MLIDAKTFKEEIVKKELEMSEVFLDLLFFKNVSPQNIKKATIFREDPLVYPFYGDCWLKFMSGNFF